MGRHSAPEDEGDLLVAPIEEPAARPRPRPRHAAPDAQRVQTEVVEPELVEREPDRPPGNVVDADVVEDEPAAPVAVLAAAPIPEPSAPPRPGPGPAEDEAVAAPARERPGRGDLRLLRENPALRARCGAALLLPFILYTVVLVVLSRLDVYLFWIWIPAILAGVLFGSQLDAASKRSAG